MNAEKEAREMRNSYPSRVKIAKLIFSVLCTIYKFSAEHDCITAYLPFRFPLVPLYFIHQLLKLVSSPHLRPRFPLIITRPPFFISFCTLAFHSAWICNFNLHLRLSEYFLARNSQTLAPARMTFILSLLLSSEY
jgi:hypothetical protein